MGAAAVAQHLPQGNWPDFRKGPLRPKIARRRDSRGMGQGVGGWQLGLKGKVQRGTRGGKEKGRCAKTQETLHEKRQKEDKWQRSNLKMKPEITKGSSGRKSQAAFPKDTFLLFWPPEGSCIPKILRKSDKCLQYFLLSAYTCEISNFCLCIQKVVFESWRFNSNFNTVSLTQ